MVKTTRYRLIPNAYPASLYVTGTNLRDSSVVRIIIGNITIDNAKEPAQTEKSPIVKTTSTKTNTPITMVGNSARTSLKNLTVLPYLLFPYSERNIPPITPTGTPIRLDSPINTMVPCIAGPIPPGSSLPTAPGILVRKSHESAADPLVKTLTKIAISGTIATTTQRNTVPLTILSNQSLLPTLYRKYVLNSALCSGVIMPILLPHVI